MLVPACAYVHMEDRGQPLEAGSHLLPREAQGQLRLSGLVPTELCWLSRVGYAGLHYSHLYHQPRGVTTHKGPPLLITN